MAMSLYRKHTGKHAVHVSRTPDGLDVVGSRTGDRLFLHVVNTRRTRSVKARFQVDGMKVASGSVHWFALDPEFEVFEHRPECVHPQQIELQRDQAWVFPPASVSAVELNLQAT